MTEKDQAERQRQAFRDNMEASVLRFHDLARQTQNPVYAWLALWSRGAVRQHEVMNGSDLADLTIPAWCADYFTQLAFDLTALAGGTDIRRDPAGDSHLYTCQVDPETGNETWSAPDLPLLPPDEAMTVVTMALGFTRKGYSAFAAFRAAMDQIGMFHRFEQLRQSGMTYTAALNSLASESAAMDESALRKRITAGRRLVRGERPEEEGAGKR